MRKTDVMSFTERPAQSSVNLFLFPLNPCCFGYQILIKLCLDLLKMLAGKKVRYITDSRHNFHIKSGGELLAVVSLELNIRIRVICSNYLYFDISSHPTTQTILIRQTTGSHASRGEGGEL